MYIFNRGNTSNCFYLLILSHLMAELSHAFDKDRALVAATLDYPPYEYLQDGEAKGIAVDILREAARRTGVDEVIFNFYPWKRAVYSTRVGESDILFNAGKNQQRQRWGNYADSTLILQNYVLFKRKGEDIQVDPDFDNVDDLAIAIRAGYLYGSGAFRQALDSDKFDFVIHAESTRQNIDLLLSGRVDLFVGDYLPVIHYINTHGLADRIDIVTQPSATGEHLVVLIWPTYLLFSKATVSHEYVEEITTAIEQMKADGFVSRIFDRYNNGEACPQPDAAVAAVIDESSLQSNEKTPANRGC